MRSSSRELARRCLRADPGTGEPTGLCADAGTAVPSTELNGRCLRCSGFWYQTLA